MTEPQFIHSKGEMGRTEGGRTGSKLTRRGLLESAGIAGAVMMMHTTAAGAQAAGSADVKISSVNTTIHNVPIKVPLLDKQMVQQIVFVEIATDAGITGYGLTGDLQTSGVREFINQQLAPFLTGKSALDTEARWQETFLTFNPRYQTGAFSSAVSAIDIALWDIKGKHLKMPVSRLLGGAKKYRACLCHLRLAPVRPRLARRICPPLPRRRSGQIQNGRCHRQWRKHRRRRDPRQRRSRSHRPQPRPHDRRQLSLLHESRLAACQVR